MSECIDGFPHGGYADSSTLAGGGPAGDAGNTLFQTSFVPGVSADTYVVDTRQQSGDWEVLESNQEQGFDSGDFLLGSDASFTYIEPVPFLSAYPDTPLGSVRRLLMPGDGMHIRVSLQAIDTADGPRFTIQGEYDGPEGFLPMNIATSGGNWRWETPGDSGVLGPVVLGEWITLCITVLPVAAAFPDNVTYVASVSGYGDAVVTPTTNSGWPPGEVDPVLSLTFRTEGGTRTANVEAGLEASCEIAAVCPLPVSLPTPKRDHEVATGSEPVPRDFAGRVLIGRTADKFTLTVESIDTRPLSISGIDWTGRAHNNTRRLP